MLMKFEEVVITNASAQNMKTDGNFDDSARCFMTDIFNKKYASYSEKEL